MPADTAARIDVLGHGIDAITLTAAVDRVVGWAKEGLSRYICLCNVHVVVTAGRQANLSETVTCSDLALPDGAPIAWAMRRGGVRNQARVAGPDVMRAVCERAATLSIAVYLYGSTCETLTRLIQALRVAFPDLVVAGSHSPPFRELSMEEDNSIVQAMNSSGARIVLVGLGCPKQELWMAAHRGRVQAVMLGVGAAFDFHAGTVRRAPVWMQRTGLEWLHRLASAPRHLWKRYLVTNSIFLWRVSTEPLRRRLRGLLLPLRN